MAMPKTKTWASGHKTEASPYARGVWVVLTDQRANAESVTDLHGQPRPPLRIAQVDIYRGAPAYPGRYDQVYVEVGSGRILCGEVHSTHLSQAEAKDGLRIWLDLLDYEDNGSYLAAYGPAWRPTPDDPPPPKPTDGP